MGFFGKLFSGKPSSSSSKQPKPAPVRNSTSSDSASDSEGPQSAFLGQHFEGLGDVWTAFFPGGSQEFVGMLQQMFPQCRPTGPVMQRKDGSSVILYTTPSSGGLSIHSNIVTRAGSGEAEFVGGYPVMESSPTPCVIEQAHIWSNNISGAVAARAQCNGALLNFFLNGFFQHVPQLQFGSPAVFHVSALALSMEKQKQTEFSPEEGTEAYEALRRAFLVGNPDKTAADFVPPVVSSHGHGMLIPTQVVAAWIYQVPVLAVEKVEFLGHSFRRIETRLAGVGDKAVFGTLYVAEHILKGYEPQVGDDVTGTLWLQASMEAAEVASPEQKGPLM